MDCVTTLLRQPPFTWWRHEPRSCALTWSTRRRPGAVGTVGLVITRSSLLLPAGEFSYLEGGKGDPVVLLHALGRSAADWTTVIEAISDGWRCLAPDQRGHGASVRCEEYTFESMTEDLRSFVDTLGLDRFFLVGHSMGGTVGWLFAESTPKRLRRLVLEDTPPPSGRHAYPETPAEPPAPVGYDWEARRQLVRQLSSPDPAWWRDLEKVTAPTLVIAGSPDEAELSEVARRLPNCDLITIRAGHWIHESQPDAFVKAIRAFFEN